MVINTPSKWTKEDQAAAIVYLHSLPAIRDQFKKKKTQRLRLVLSFNPHIAPEPPPY
jgi:hypothetical protein